MKATTPAAEFMVKDLSAGFCAAFNKEYAATRLMYSKEEWKHVWDSNEAWNHLMLWNPDPPQVRPLLELVADEMGFEYWNKGEPFRIDAAFVHEDRRVPGSVPFPMLVAIEHENAVNTLEEEMAKLLHLRCLLKIAITYPPPGARNGPQVVLWQDKIKSWAQKMEASLGRYTGEDPAAEYLFLLGVEEEPQLHVWNALSFSSGSKVSDAPWQRIDPFQPM
jgi:hypothetical protein